MKERECKKAGDIKYLYKLRDKGLIKKTCRNMRK